MRAEVPLTSSLRVDGKAPLTPRARFARYRFAYLFNPPVSVFPNPVIPFVFFLCCSDAFGFPVIQGGLRELSTANFSEESKLRYKRRRERKVILLLSFRGFE